MSFVSDRLATVLHHVALRFVSSGRLVHVYIMEAVVSFFVVVGGSGGVWCPVQFGLVHLQSNLFQLYTGTLAFSSAITALLARYA